MGHSWDASKPAPLSPGGLPSRVGTASPRGRVGSFWKEVVCHSDRVPPALKGVGRDLRHTTGAASDMSPGSRTSFGTVMQGKNLFVTVLV